MNEKLSTVTFLHLLTFGLLVAFQVLFVLGSPVRTHWEVYVLGVGMDSLLLAAFYRASKFRRQAEQERLRRAEEELQTLVALTGSQQAQWRATLGALAELDREDLATAQEICDLLGADAAPEASAPLPPGEGATVPSLVAAIDSVVALNHRLTQNVGTVLEFYRQTHLRLRQIQAAYRLNHYRLGETVTFLGRMGGRTNRYSETLVLEVLESFRQITEFSEGISTDVMDRIHRLMDPSHPESLDAISRTTRSIHATMDRFFANLGSANAFSDRAVAENLAQMARVQEMALAIEDFSESIRMISLNLNIEAARVTQHGGAGGSGRSFQVLASKLSEFAVKAKELAEQQQRTIDAASKVMESSGRAQMNQLAELMAEVPRIQGQLNPFETIVRGSYAEFEQVVTTMERLAASISERLKAVIGKFQFQDLVRQEQEHVLQFLGHLNELASHSGDRGAVLDDATKAKALEELLRAYEALASTENEKAVLHEYRHRSGQDSAEEEPDGVTAGSVSLF